MKCAVCRTETLQPQTLDPNLPAYTCAKCAGTWIASSDYWTWRDQQRAGLLEVPAADTAPERTDSDQPKTCPSCGHILLPYHIGHDVTFTLDHCGNCNGVWLDAQEWNILRQRNLHDKIHTFFTESWQRRIRQAAHQRRMQDIYVQKFGALDYAELRRVKAWIGAHPQQNALLAYLTSDDPYKL